jgi:hypothetical protein
LHTERKRFGEKLKKARKWLWANRTLPIKDIMGRVKSSLEGHFNYYGVPTNYKSISNYKYFVVVAVYRALNRRGQRRSCNWDEFNNKILKRFPLPTPGIRALKET